jgi:hypothetical protein
MNPPTPIGTKMGINYPIQKWAPKPIHTKIDTHSAPRAPPPGPLSAGGAPLAGGPPGPGGSDQSSFPPLLLLLDGSGSATLPVIHPHTAPGPPHPRYGPTCPQVHL